MRVRVIPRPFDALTARILGSHRRDRGRSGADGGGMELVETRQKWMGADALADGRTRSFKEKVTGRIPSGLPV
jgi:hypothetical protein